MSTEYDNLMRQYDIPPGALTAEELRLLKNGGIRLDDSDDEADAPYPLNPNRQTQPRGNHMRQPAPVEAEAVKQIYENELSKKDKQIWYLQNENAQRERMWEAEKFRI